MDLLKMHPMARKMAVHSEAFAKALEDGNAQEAQDHINEGRKFAGFHVPQLAGVLPGTIIAARTHNRARVHRGTFGRFVPDS